MPDTLLRLGPCEVDLTAREIRVEGRPRPIEPRAFELLACLAERCDRVVTKQELLSTVWPGQRVSDAALARAVMKARQAIGDTGDPALIRTVPRVGYRLMAPPSGAANHIAAVAVAVAPAPGPAALAHPAAPAQAGTPLRIALLPFENATGDASLEWIELGLMSLVMHALGHDLRLSPVAMPSLLTAIDGARRVPGVDLQAAVREATGAQVLVQARMSRHEHGYRLRFNAGHASDSTRGHVDAATPAELAPRLARAIEEALFPGAPATGRLDLDCSDPLAISAFARGLQAFARQTYPQAVNLLKMALELAPGSAPVQLELLRALGGMGDLDAGQPLARRLLARAERTGDLMLAARVHLAMGRMHLNRSAFVPAAFRVEKGLRLMGDEGPLDELASAQLMRSQIAAYQQDTAAMELALERMRVLCERSGNRVQPLSRLNMLAVAAWTRGDYERAAELSAQATHEARAVHAHRVIVSAAANCAEYLTLLGRWAEAAAHAEEAFAAATLLDDPVSICLAAYGACWIYRLSGSLAASQRIVAALPPADQLAPLPRQWTLQTRGHHAAAAGDHAEAAQLFAQALQLLREGENRLNEQETLPWYLCALVQTGHLDEAEAELAAATRPPHSANLEFQRWLLHSRALLSHARGRTAEALQALEELAASDTAPLWRAWACIDAAWLHAEAGRAERALQLLQQLPPTFTAQPVALAAAARAQFAAGDTATARRLHLRALDAGRQREPQPYLAALTACYAEGRTPPPAPCLPSRL
jgi:DNA-binding winged helix-turn-helix (wHTH) protein/tetratricopeptide (TPR) repeat protein